MVDAAVGGGNEERLYGSDFERSWEQKKKHYEIFFCNEFVSHYPWESCQETSPAPPIEVAKLYHATHRKSANEIRTQEVSFFTFRSAPKKGKRGYDMVDGSPLGKSYKCKLDGEIPNGHTHYQYVSDEEHLLPEGNYSWWGLKPDKDSSRYGGHMFIVDFPYMLDQFCHAHTTSANPQPGIFFKKAGTLRYKREICYVILVCADTDNLTDDVLQLPPVTEEGGHITLNGLLDENGKVISRNSHLVYNKRSYEEWNWEQLVFGFYFSRNNRLLLLEEERVEYDAEYPHNYCIRTFKVKPQYRRRKGWCCPDDPDLPPDMEMEELIDTP